MVLEVLVPKWTTSLSPSDDVVVLLDPLTMMWLILLPILAGEDPSSDPLRLVLLLLR